MKFSFIFDIPFISCGVALAGVCWIDEFKRITCVITFHFITMHSHYWFIFHVILYVVVDVFKY
jgi:hypothetical protein